MKRPDWYKHGWSLDIKKLSWTEDTDSQVDFIIRTLGLTGTQRILDLACGYGRHALALARMGYEVVGVDITPAYIEDAREHAAREGLPAQFILSDIREVAFDSEFDVVLNMADGAVGYLENDAENLKIFDVVAKALRPGGRHFMDICNAEHAQKYFPKKHWEAGEKALALAQFDWDPKTRRMTYGGWSVPYGKEAHKPAIAMENADPIRLYSLSEVEDIFAPKGLAITSAYCDFQGNPASDQELQLLICSQKK